MSSSKESSVLYSANQLLQTPPPPTLREILTAYRTKGDGDREMLLAMLNAKAAEEQRLTQTASLQRSLLEIYQYSGSHTTLPPLQHQQIHNYPSPSSLSSADDYYRQNYSTSHYRHHHQSSEPLRKKRRASQSPYARPRSPPSPRYHDLPYSRASPGVLPPSPYSEETGSMSPPAAPRSTASMGIGSLLSESRSTDSDARRRSPSHDRESVSSS